MNVHKMNISSGDNMNKIDEYVRNAFSDIIEDSSEAKAYMLGVAYGYLQFYRFFKSKYDKDVLSKTFGAIVRGTDEFSAHFRKLIEIEDGSSGDNC